MTAKKVDEQKKNQQFTQFKLLADLNKEINNKQLFLKQLKDRVDKEINDTNEKIYKVSNKLTEKQRTLEAIVEKLEIKKAKLREPLDKEWKILEEEREEFVKEKQELEEEKLRLEKIQLENKAILREITRNLSQLQADKEEHEKTYTKAMEGLKDLEKKKAVFEKKFTRYKEEREKYLLESEEREKNLIQREKATQSLLKLIEKREQLIQSDLKRIKSERAALTIAKREIYGRS